MENNKKLVEENEELRLEIKLLNEEINEILKERRKGK